MSSTISLDAAYVGICVVRHCLCSDLTFYIRELPSSMSGHSPDLGQHHGISVSAFYDAFNALWLRRHGRIPSFNSKLRFGTATGALAQGYSLTLTGIAVSGGVDSMALATLCSMLKENEFARKIYNFNFQAFVVDHRARDGSGIEAAIVKAKLLRMGIFVVSPVKIHN